MYLKTKLLVATLILIFFQQHLLTAQNVKDKFNVGDKRTPKKAAIRSAILPGLGQVYNRNVWKVPIVYATIGGTGLVLISNVQWYLRLRDAYKVAYNIHLGNDTIGSIAYKKIDKQIRRIFFEGSYGIQMESIKIERDGTRKYVDYAALYFIIAWALNVMDATVDAHLSKFDVSDDLSFALKPAVDMNLRTAGLSLVLNVK